MSVESDTQRIRAALEALGDAPAPPLPHPDRASAFIANVLRNGGSADHAITRGDVVAAVARYLQRQFRSLRLVVANDPRLAVLPWRDAGLLPRFGAAQDGDTAALCHAELAVAETGSVVSYTGRTHPPANNLLPESQLVLVDTTAVVANLEAAWEQIDARMQRDGRPRGINFVSGPSSTADIEGELVRGAHGPRAWHVILWGEAAAEQVAAGTAAARSPAVAQSGV